MLFYLLNQLSEVDDIETKGFFLLDELLLNFNAYRQSNQVSSNYTMALYVITGTFPLPMEEIPTAALITVQICLGKKVQSSVIRIVWKDPPTGDFVMGNAGTFRCMLFGGHFCCK
jgi:hypothetical protein